MTNHYGLFLLDTMDVTYISRKEKINIKKMKLYKEVRVLILIAAYWGIQWFQKWTNVPKKKKQKTSKCSTQLVFLTLFAANRGQKKSQTPKIQALKLPTGVSWGYFVYSAGMPCATVVNQPSRRDCFSMSGILEGVTPLLDFCRSFSVYITARLPWVCPGGDRCILLWLAEPQPSISKPVWLGHNNFG
jgi:hypothetical protein